MPVKQRTAGLILTQTRPTTFFLTVGPYTSPQTEYYMLTTLQSTVVFLPHDVNYCIVVKDRTKQQHKQILRGPKGPYPQDEKSRPFCLTYGVHLL